MAAPRPVIDGPLAAALAEGRTRYNASFAAARWGRPALDPDAFVAELAGPVDAIVRAVHARRPERVGTVVDALWHAALELVGRDLAGPRARTTAVDRGWSTLLAAVPDLVADEPVRVVAAVSNALVRLAAAPSARIEDWLSTMRAVAATGAGVDDWLEAGKAAAWRAGLAYARHDALSICARLPATVAAAVLGLDDASRVQDAIARLRADPWTKPGAAAGKPKLVKAARLGGFIGLGGCLLTPPWVVVTEEGALFAIDAQGAWEIHADVFGACLVRSHVEDARRASPSTPSLDARGTVRVGEVKASFPELSGASSWTSTPHTLVATLPTSHWIHVVALSSA